MTDAATIMLVDDHAIVREGYRSLLQKQPRLKVVAEASDGAEAYRLFKEVKPDLVIMDLTMPGFGGIEAIKRIRQWDPDRPHSGLHHASERRLSPCRRSGPAPRAMSRKAVRRKRWCAPHSMCCKAKSRSAPTSITSLR